MKTKMFIFSLILAGLTYLSVALTTEPKLSLSSVNTPGSINLTLQIQGIANIENVQFVGLDNNFQIVGREVTIKTSSDNIESGNIFVNKLILAPIKAESATIYATAKLNGKNVASNKVTVIVTQKQLTEFKKQQDQQALTNRKNMEEMHKKLIKQIEAQQKFFDDISAIIQKQQAEMLKNTY